MYLTFNLYYHTHHTTNGLNAFRKAFDLMSFDVVRVLFDKMKVPKSLCTNICDGLAMCILHAFVRPAVHVCVLVYMLLVK